MFLSAEQLVIRRGGTFALRGVSATFPNGTRALVRGPAGSGKTTLLKALAGLVRPTSGAVQWEGEDVAHLLPAERRARQAQFGMVFQSDALFDSDTVLQNVMLPLLKRQVPREDARARARAALAEVDLLDAEGERPEVLSGGMRKRVGIARAAVAEPAVLLADDPFAGLDPHTAQGVGELLARAAAGRTLIVAAPEATPWLTLPTRLELREGELRPPGGQ